MTTLVPERRKGNLPAEVTSFIGRRRELSQVRDALERYRLVTLRGVGGVGKTRLALHLAVSERTLNRRFKLAIGEAPLHYLQSLRVDVAKVVDRIEYVRRNEDDVLPASRNE